MDPFKIWDPEFAPMGLSLLESKRTGTPPPAVHDIETRREQAKPFMKLIDNARPHPTDVSQKDFHTTTSDGHVLLLRWYYPTALPPVPRLPGSSAILEIHGGGMIMSRVGDLDNSVSLLVSQTGVPFLSVDYRLAPESRAPTQAEDAYAGLKWLHEHAEEMGVDKERIGIYGASSGGGIAASAALIARDRGLSPALKAQILIYPMLDDRTATKHPLHEEFFVWRTEDNITGWSAMLGFDVEKPEEQEKHGKDVSPYAVPARAKSLEGLPKTFIDVGGLDRFVEEDVAYAARMIKEGVQVELHVRPGLPHAYEALTPDIGATVRAVLDRIRAVQWL